MLKLLIYKDKQKWFQQFFGFLLKEKCELCLFPDGLKWRNNRGNGIVKSSMFAVYSFEHKRKLGRMDGNQKILKEWFGKWESNSGMVIIPIK